MAYPCVPAFPDTPTEALNDVRTGTSLTLVLLLLLIVAAAVVQLTRAAGMSS